MRRVLYALLHDKSTEISSIQAEYSLILSPELSYLNSLVQDEHTFEPNLKPLVVPGTQPLSTRASKYLESRNFDPRYLEGKYDLRSTKNMGNYRFRIISPIYYENRIVSFQGRDYTNQQELRYKDCRKEDAIIYHKEILYNLDNCNLDRVLVVEDVYVEWRLGDNTVCTFGTGFTRNQIKLLTKKFKVIRVLYDSESTAKKKAEDAIVKLLSFGVDADFAPEIDAEDPAEMNAKDAILYKKDLSLY
jgi:DNA primase